MDGDKWALYERRILIADILGFMIGEELESCLRDVYKATLLDS